jgi:hypothetical protein
MADERDLRIGKNEILYRAVNEEVHGLDARLGAASLPTQSFLCECGNMACTERIELTNEEYEQVRTDPTTFALVNGHELPEVEYVVRRTDRYCVVRKRAGDPAELAARHAPD